jgi:hypothetical protein
MNVPYNLVLTYGLPTTRAIFDLSHAGKPDQIIIVRQMITSNDTGSSIVTSTNGTSPSLVGK